MKTTSRDSIWYIEEDMPVRCTFADDVLLVGGFRLKMESKYGDQDISNCKYSSRYLLWDCHHCNGAFRADKLYPGSLLQLIKGTSALDRVLGLLIILLSSSPSTVYLTAPSSDLIATAPDLQYGS